MGEQSYTVIKKICDRCDNDQVFEGNDDRHQWATVTMYTYFFGISDKSLLCPQCADKLSAFMCWDIQPVPTKDQL